MTSTLPHTRPTPLSTTTYTPRARRRRVVDSGRIYGAPFPSKNVNYPSLPGKRDSGLAGSHNTPPILYYKDMTSAPREGYFDTARARGVYICICSARKSVGHETNDRVMVHGDGTRADGRRSGFKAHLSEIVGRETDEPPGAFGTVNQMCDRSGGSDGPSYNRSA